MHSISDYMRSVLINESYKRSFHHDANLICYRLYNEAQKFSIDSNYCIGVDWLIPEKAAIYVEPKLNTEVREVDFLGMLLESLNATENLEHLETLYYVDYDQPQIKIPEKKDLLSPLLIIRFLKLVQKIVRKGLKKSYYRVTENLNSRVKGKILIAQQTKENIVKNRITQTVCNYQQHGINTHENQFLKQVLTFVSSWLNGKPCVLSEYQYPLFQNLIRYCQPAFEQVDVLSDQHQTIHYQRNSFYKEYEEALKVGKAILKRFSFNISKTGTTHASTPPFWIDMSKLFELYVFQKLKQLFPEPGAISYHDSFLGGKETDILIRAEGYQCVVDCKYKPQYHNSVPSLADKRQLAGYTRLKSVYSKLGIDKDKIIRGVLIYSHQSCQNTIEKEQVFATEIGEYMDFYTLGIQLPEIDSTE